MLYASCYVWRVARSFATSFATNVASAYLGIGLVEDSASSKDFDFREGKAPLHTAASQARRGSNGGQ
jgi:hypothetical protein